MYVGHSRLSVARCIPTLLHGRGCNLGNGTGCPLVVHYWTDLQSTPGFRCCDDIAPNAKCQRVLLCSLYAWFLLITALFVPVFRSAKNQTPLRYPSRRQVRGWSQICRRPANSCQLAAGLRPGSDLSATRIA